jgi:hypothetical protein
MSPAFQSGLLFLAKAALCLPEPLPFLYFAVMKNPKFQL